MEAYLDNSATTRCLESVRDVVSKTMLEDYGNPSSKHMKGVESERYLKDARETIAKTLKVNEKEIYFTSGGTESNNWALLGSAYASRRAGKHIITTAIEHAAVLMPLQFLAEQGYRITHLPVDEHGHISLADLKAALDEETILVSIMMVNNEIGAIEPVAEAGEIIKKYNPDILFHVGFHDCVNIKLIQMFIDSPLLNTSYNSTHDPVQTHTSRKSQTEPCRHERHHHVHGLHSIIHIRITCRLLRHHLKVEPLSQSSKHRYKNCSKYHQKCTSGNTSLDHIHR